MGCVPSKVGQEPPEPPVGHGLHKGGEGQAPEESRPAVRVVGPTEGKRGKSRSRPAAQQIQQRGGARWGQRAGDEKEGETVTDESGLQMRTPRTSTEPGLHHAAKNGDLPLVHRLLGHNTGGCENQARDTGGSIPDRAASSMTVPDVDERGMWGNTPLLVATQYAHPDVALALIEGGAKTCLENERRATALHFSCAEGFGDVSEALIKNGADVDPPVAAIHHPSLNGGQIEPFTPLSAAAGGGHTELVRLLVQHGAEVNRAVVPKSTDGKYTRRGSFMNTDGVGGSALTTAARQGHTEVCLVLVDSGASILFEDWDARTPLLHAIRGRHEQTTLALLDSARLAECARQLADTCESDRGGAKASGLAPLHAACDNGMHRAVKALCATGADIEKRDAAGATPLLHACKKGQVECARELLSTGANPMVKDNTGNTPTSIAHSRSDQPRGEELLKLIEAAVAGAEGREDQSGVKRNFQTAEADRPTDNYITTGDAGDDRTDHIEPGQKGSNDDTDEDVLLVSDWDQEEEEEEDILDNCDMVDRPSSDNNHRNTDQSRCDSTAVDKPAIGIQEDDVQEDGEDDVLLVDDYNPDVEEGLEFVEMSSPVAMRSGDMGTQEMQHSTEATEEHKLSNGTLEYAVNRVKNGRDQSYTSCEQDLVGQPKITILPTNMQGGEHRVTTQDLTAKLLALQVGAESVDTAMIAAADNVVGARPSGGG